MKTRNIILSATLTLCTMVSTPVYSADDLNKSDQFFAFVKGQKVNINDEKSLLIDKLGEPTSDSEEQTAWLFDDGVTFIAVLKNDKLIEATLSSSMPNEESFVVIYGEKNHLSTETIDKLEDKYQETYRCLSYFEQEGLGWMDYMIQDSSGNDLYATFSAINHSQYSLATLEGKIQTKLSLIDSITLRQGQESFSTDVYCKEWYQRN